MCDQAWNQGVDFYQILQHVFRGKRKYLLNIY